MLASRSQRREKRPGEENRGVGRGVCKKGTFSVITVHVIFDQWGDEIDDRGGSVGEEGVIQQFPRGGTRRPGRQTALKEGKKRGIDLLDAKQSRGGLILRETPGEETTDRMADLMNDASSSSPYLRIGETWKPRYG